MGVRCCSGANEGSGERGGGGWKEWVRRGKKEEIEGVCGRGGFGG